MVVVVMAKLMVKVLEMEIISIRLSLIALHNSKTASLIKWNILI